MVADRFETKRGECRIEDGTLVLDESIRQQFENWYRGYWQEGGRTGTLLFLGLLLGASWVVLYPLVLAVSGRWTMLAIFGVAIILVLGVLRAINRWRSFTSRARIPLDSISEVTLNRGTSGITRPRFVVTYEVDGEERHRYVMLPSTFMAHGEERIETAIVVFERHGFDIDDPTAGGDPNHHDSDGTGKNGQ